jgi:hypothetical protein
MVVDSDGVVFRRVAITAQDGLDGADGTVSPYVAGDAWPSAAELHGDSSKGVQLSDSFPLEPQNGEATSVTCPGSGETTVGGAGGDRPADGSNNTSSGEPGLPEATGGDGGFVAVPQAVGSGCDSLGANFLCVCTPVPGVDGSAGANGSSGDGALSRGTLSATGWQPQAGEAGNSGSPGGGGGGGDGAWWDSSSGFYGGWTGGGGGAAGGCGGVGGGGGQGGGGSIALISLQSQVTLQDCTLTTGNAGAGGDGVDGQAGQSGGTGGAAPAVVESNINSYPCAGGDGGNGGAGGQGGGGAGGVAIAIGWSGTAPVVQSSMFAVGDPGAAGQGGNGNAVSGYSNDTRELSTE